MTITSRRWGLVLAVGSGAGAIGGGFVVVRHFATTPWPLSGGEPGILAAAGVLLGAATQVGAGAAALMAAGVGASPAVAVALAAGALGVLAGAAAVLGAVAWRLTLALAPVRAAV